MLALARACTHKIAVGDSDVSMCAWLEDCGNLIRQNSNALGAGMAKLVNRRTFLPLSGNGVAMPMMVARVALGAAIVTEQKHGG